MFKAKTPAQQCPICGTRHHIEAVRCNQCGALLTGAPETIVESTQPILPPGSRRDLDLEGPPHARWDHGDADLYEGMLPSTPTHLLAIGAVLIVLLLGAAAFVLAQAGFFTGAQLEPTAVALLGTPTLPLRKSALPTNAKPVIMPTLNLPTVTPAPPTATVTPTQGPCIQTAKQGDTLYALAARCGHRDGDVIDIILRLNNMTSPAQLQIGQKLQIPWPTATGSAPVAGDQPTATNASAAIEPTLPAGIKWYTVKKGDTALSVVFENNMTMKTLQDLNPEVRFDQCDFSSPAGGPNCQVMLYEGQRLRVPSGEAAVTAVPTLTGSETPAMPPTATINVPISLQPDDRMLFESFDVPTLRWLAPGSLSSNQVYMVIVTDQTTGVIFTATTRDLSFQLPAEWQPNDKQMHEFQWRIAMADIGTTQTPVPSAYSSEVRRFSWHGK
ncbi:MAG: LysM peptidoglycan-binding domain-containing protein [Anaerolineae bacterium]|nr:LysM peptidoglycan-binding domain-containing protein [Anaerolineae bacterium]